MENITVNCNNIQISNNNKICLIAGPCQLETEQHAMDMAGKIKEITDKFKEYWDPDIKGYLSNKVLEDFFLMSKCKHFAVAPTSFHWWAAWLNNGSDKVCLRPSNEILNPSKNSDFWPKAWIAI